MKKIFKKALTLTSILALFGLATNAQNVNIDSLRNNNIIPTETSARFSIEDTVSWVNVNNSSNYMQTNSDYSFFNVDTNQSSLKKPYLLLHNDTSILDSAEKVNIAADNRIHLFDLSSEVNVPSAWLNMREDVYGEFDYTITGSTNDSANVVFTKVANGDTVLNETSNAIGNYSDAFTILYEDSIPVNAHFSKGTNFIPKDTTFTLYKGANNITPVLLTETFDYTVVGTIISSFNGSNINSAHVVGVDTLTNDTIFNASTNSSGIFTDTKTDLLANPIDVRFYLTATGHVDKDTVINLNPGSVNFINNNIVMDAITYDHIIAGLTESNGTVTVKDIGGTLLDVIVANSLGQFEDTVTFFNSNEALRFDVDATGYESITDTLVSTNTGTNVFDLQLDTIYNFVMNGIVDPVGAEVLFTDALNGDTLIYQTSNALGYSNSFNRTDSTVVANVLVSEPGYDDLITSVILSPDTNTNDYTLNLTPVLHTYTLFGAMHANGHIDVEEGINPLISMDVNSSGTYNDQFTSYNDSINATYHLSAPGFNDKDTTLWINPGVNLHSFNLDPKVYNFDISFGTESGAQLICDENGTIDTLVANVTGGANLAFTSNDSLLTLDVNASAHNFEDKDTTFVIHGNQNEYFMIPLIASPLHDFSFYGQVQPDSVQMSLTEQGFPNDTIFNIITTNLNDSVGSFSEFFQNANDSVPFNLHLAYVGSNPNYVNSTLDTTLNLISGGNFGDFVLNQSTGINELQKQEGQTNAFPNPHTDKFAIKYTNEALDKGQVGLFDMQGKAVNVETTIDPENNIIYFDTKNISSGVYNARSTTDDGTIYNHLIIKQNE